MGLRRLSAGGLPRSAHPVRCESGRTRAAARTGKTGVVRRRCVRARRTGAVPRTRRHPARRNSAARDRRAASPGLRRNGRSKRRDAGISASGPRAQDASASPRHWSLPGGDAPPSSGNGCDAGPAGSGCCSRSRGHPRSAGSSTCVQWRGDRDAALRELPAKRRASRGSASPHFVNSPAGDATARGRCARRGIAPAGCAARAAAPAASWCGSARGRTTGAASPASASRRPTR